MILLEQNTTNNVYLTLSESQTLTGSPVYFLFNFTDETTKEQVNFITQNISTNIIRYDKFEITLTASTASNIDYTNGIISLNPYGNWTYKVYEQYSSTNLNIEDADGGPIEYGAVKVKPSETINTDAIVAEYTGMTDTYYYYQPGQ